MLRATAPALLTSLPPNGEHDLPLADTPESRHGQPLPNRVTRRSRGGAAGSTTETGAAPAGTTRPFIRRPLGPRRRPQRARLRTP